MAKPLIQLGSILKRKPKKLRVRTPELVAHSVIAAGSARFAIGLLWQLRGAGQTVADQGRAVSVGADSFDLYAPHADGKQIGFGASEEGLRRGMRAAASIVTPDAKADTWVAAFRVVSQIRRVPEAWWIVAHRDGLVYEDRLLLDKDEARAAFLDISEAPGWQRVVCPADWEVPQSDEVSLDEILALRTRGGVLRPLSRVSQWLPRVAAVLFLGVLGSGAWYAWSLWQLEQARLIEMLRQAELAAQISAPKPPPWIDAPELADFVIGCNAAFDALFIPVPGWRNEPLHCGFDGAGATADAQWVPERGNVAHLLAAVRNQGLGEPAIDPITLRGKSARNVDLAPRPADRAGSPVAPDAIQLRLRSRFQYLGLEMTLNPKIVAPAGGAVRGQPPAAYNYHELTIQMSVAPEEHVRLLSDVPGLVPERLSYDPSTYDWTLVARIYHPQQEGG
jgi:hypothetical protein